MQKRLAQRGPNAGNHFWGCRSYPNCKGAVNLDGQASDGGDGVDGIPRGTVLPRLLATEGISQAHRAVFFDTATLPRWLVKSLARNQGSPLARYVWRIDLPTFEPDQNAYHPGIDTAYAFLLRGAVTAASPSLVAACELDEIPARDEIDAQCKQLPAYLAPPTALHCGEQTLDSVEERMLYKALLSEVARGNLAVSVVPQVGFQSLAPSSELADAGFRVDFVVSGANGKALVVEVDGEQHATEQSNDVRRDEALTNAGYEVLRLTASDVRKNPAGAAREVLAELGASKWQAADAAVLNLQRLAQLQIAIVAALRAGLVPSVGRVPIRVAFADPSRQLAPALVQIALDDLADLIRDIALARGDAAPELSLVLDDPSEAFVFRFGSSTDQLDRSTVYIHDLIRFAPPLVELGAADPPPGLPVDREATRRLFERCYGFADFRPGQFEAVARVIRGLDTLLLLPTGAGKSATYQFATLIRGGVCVVVDPLLSLIDDQIQNLREHGVDRSVQVSSQIDPVQRKALVTLLCQGHMSFVFVSPERLQQISFREAIQIVALRRGIALIAIDEAHCVSQWGHDFRPAYLNVAKTIRGHSRQASGVAPPVLAMTGTASYAVLRDIQREVGITDPDAQITPNDFDRRELRFEIIQCRTPDKGAELAKVLVGLHKRFKVRDPDSFWNRRKDSPITGLVFCPHVNGQHGTVDVANAVRRALPGVSIATHSGKAPKGSTDGDWRQAKREAAAQFKRDDVQVLACTNSFGMGIDKPNIRFTVHWGLPQSIESYYQEAGRAGRGRMESWCFLLVSDDNPKLADEQLAGRGPSTEPPFASQSDIDRQLFFHKSSFPDAARELAQLKAFITECMLSGKQVVDISFTGDSDKQIRERAVYRLLLIGVASDYTVDWRTGSFQVHLSDSTPESIIDCFTNYVSAFNAKRGRAIKLEMQKSLTAQTSALTVANHAGEQLIRFTYDQIEGTRRRALSEMRRVARENAGNEDGFRHALLAYLSTSAFSAMLQAIIDDAGGGLELISDILERIESPLDAADLASQSARLLASIYDHPGLLTIRAVALLVSTNPDPQAAAQDLALAFESAEKFDLDEHSILAVLDDAVLQVGVGETLLLEVAQALTSTEASPERAKRNASILAHSETAPLADPALSYLAKGVLRGTTQLLETLKDAF